uniref:Uncharacterized protein n=1 Tax=Avena sativa TaxID=4498 RepID=A0ACD5UE11_AVESA
MCTSFSSAMQRLRNQLCSKCAAAVVLLLALGLGATTLTEADTDTFIYAACSPSKYDPGSAFEANLKSLLTSITNASPTAAYSSFTAGNNGTTGDTPAAAAYGLYQCRGDLGNGDCGSCVRDALAQLNQMCPGAYAASLQLEGCYVRYDSTSFLGQQDTAMVYRKCSTSTSSDASFLGSRDAVLGVLQVGGANGYRTGSSGSVQGVSQCLGDLAAADCTACLAQAVGQLKGTCGTALAADVHLAQCYVRYWASGYYFRPSQDYSQDDVGRTVAIIIGILAGLALIVVFISFLRKSC